MRIVHFAYGGSSSQDCLNVGYVSQLLQDMIQKIYGPNNYLSKKIYTVQTIVVPLPCDLKEKLFRL
jgi:hypothetical protein